MLPYSGIHKRNSRLRRAGRDLRPFHETLYHILFALGGGSASESQPYRGLGLRHRPLALDQAAAERRADSPRGLQTGGHGAGGRFV